MQSRRRAACHASGTSCTLRAAKSKFVERCLESIEEGLVRRGVNGFDIVYMNEACDWREGRCRVPTHNVRGIVRGIAREVSSEHE